MSKLAVIGCTALLLMLNANPDRTQFSKYKTVEAYEIRPGILMMPSYAADGQVCEIGPERRRYSPEVIRLDSDIPDKDLNELIDELAPAAERGPRSKGLLGEDFVEIDGGGMTAVRDYENVSIDIFSHVSHLQNSVSRVTYAAGIANFRIGLSGPTPKWKASPPYAAYRFRRTESIPSDHARRFVSRTAGAVGPIVGQASATGSGSERG
jgi:hypothetical protein